MATGSGARTAVDVWTSARDLATILRVPVGTIHRWASEHQWPRIGRGKRVRYDHAAAVKVLEKRLERERNADANR